MTTIPEALAIAARHHEAGRLREAEQIYRQILAIDPQDVDALHLLGVIGLQAGQHQIAVECIRRAIEMDPSRPTMHLNLGTCLQAQGKLDEAIGAFRRAVEMEPDNAGAHFNLGNAFNAQEQLDEAVASYRRAVELQPDHAKANNNLGTALQALGRPDEAAACFRRTLALNPAQAESHSNLLLALQYVSGATLSGLSATHAEYDQRWAAPLRTSWRPHDNVREPERPLRLGFVSPNFGMHPVGYFLISALENFDRGRFETACYCDWIMRDELTSRLEAAAMVWRDVNGLSDQQLAEQIRDDRIDILFDLAGHTARNRLLMFARKPAPIQVTWAGYVGTTGLKAMDYILADRNEIPPGAEGHYCERVLRMPDGYVCYEPPAYAPPVTPLPALKQGMVTFGSFNNRAKITPQVIEVWARVLERVPRSRLILKSRGMNDDSITGALAEGFASRGIDPGRVECLGWSPHEELLAEYNRIDLGLDTFPYNGGLTTCESLWMGVPVVTCAGETFANRHSLSHLSNIGLTQTIAKDLDDYVDLAVSLANDLPRLSALRSGLRERMAASPLCDGKRFAENLMGVLRDVWRQWCHAEVR